MKLRTTLAGRAGRRPALALDSLFAAALALVLGILFVPAEGRADEKPWERIRSEDGIVVSRKEIPGSSFVAFKGEGDVDYPLQTVGNVLVDVEHEKEWIDGVVEAKVLRKVSDNEYVVYSHVGMPVPLSDRDFVTSVTITADAQAKKLTLKMRSVTDSTGPETKYVRAQLKDSVFVLTSIEGGKKTHVEAEIHCDPAGSVPAFIVNLFQKNWGYKTIASLRKQAGKSTVASNATLEALLKSKGLVP